MDIQTKAILKKRLFGARIKKLMIENLLSVVEEFKHYKKVNKRFVDAMNASFPEMYTWIAKEYGRTKLRVRWNDCSDEFVERPELEIGMYGEDLTWQHILDDIVRYKIDESIVQYQARIDSFDEDYEKIKMLQTSLASLNISNFYYEIRDISRTIESIINYGLKE